jgi:hypothetical protein
VRRPLIDTRDIALGIRMHPFQLQMSRHTKDPEALEQHEGGTRQNADPRDVSEQEDAGAAEHLSVAVKGAAGTYPVQSVAISGNQLQSVAIRGNQRRNVSCAISGHQWPSVVISCNQLQSVEISGNQRRNVSCRSRSCGCKEVSSRVLRCTQWQSVLVTFRSRSRGSRDVINGNQVHSVAISAPHLPFEIAWVNCGTDKREHETTPHMPHAPCTAQASTGSSICIRIIILEAARYTQPPTAPMMTPAHGITVAQPAVMETSPARIPLHIATTSHECRAPSIFSRLMLVIPDEGGHQRSSVAISGNHSSFRGSCS